MTAMTGGFYDPVSIQIPTGTVEVATEAQSGDTSMSSVSARNN
jgi:hypothetical protein